MHNPWRGEIELELQGRQFVLRPSFQAISQLEQTLGCGILCLVRRMQSGDVRLGDIVAIIEAGICGSGGSIDREWLGETVLRHGLTKVMPDIVRFLQAALGVEDA